MTITPLCCGDHIILREKILYCILSGNLKEKEMNEYIPIVVICVLIVMLDRLVVMGII
jgi:hypothetical protein